MAITLQDICNFVERIHILTSAKGTLFKEPNTRLPNNGIYVFFENNQKIFIRSREVDRIVRIGINEKPNNFLKRLRGHYKGNIRGSIFRANIGWSLLEYQGKIPK